METWSEDDDQLWLDSCLIQEECVDLLLSDAPADCIYCRLKRMDEEDVD